MSMTATNKETAETNGKPLGTADDVIADKITVLKTEISELQQKLKLSEAELTETRAKLSKTQRLYDKSQNYQEDLRQEVEKLGKELHDLRSQVKGTNLKHASTQVYSDLPDPVSEHYKAYMAWYAQYGVQAAAYSYPTDLPNTVYPPTPVTSTTSTETAASEPAAEAGSGEEKTQDSSSKKDSDDCIVGEQTEPSSVSMAVSDSPVMTQTTVSGGITAHTLVTPAGPELPTTVTSVTESAPAPVWTGEDTAVHSLSAGSIADEVRAAAEQATQQSGFVYDPNTGLYYDHGSGYYYDMEKSLYYDSSSGTYFSYDQATQQYTFHSRLDNTQFAQMEHALKLSAQQQQAANENQEAPPAAAQRIQKPRDYDWQDEDQSESSAQDMWSRAQKGAPARGGGPYEDMDASEYYDEEQYHKEINRGKPERRDVYDDVDPYDEYYGQPEEFDAAYGGDVMTGSQEDTDRPEKESEKKAKKSKKHKKERKRSKHSKSERSHKRSRVEKPGSGDENCDTMEDGEVASTADSGDESGSTKSRSRSPDERHRRHKRRHGSQSRTRQRSLSRSRAGRRARSHTPRSRSRSRSAGEGHEDTEEYSERRRHRRRRDLFQGVARPQIQRRQGHVPQKENPLYYPPCIRAMVVQSATLPIGSLTILDHVTRATIGRERSMNHTITVEDIQASKEHACIEYCPDIRQYTVTDLGSQNGTTVNGERLSESKLESEPRRLHHLDLLRIGDTELQLHIHLGTDTCDGCEPGLVQARLQQEAAAANASKATTEKSRRTQLKNIKKKFGLGNAGYEDDDKALKNPAYQDKAAARRRTVGSDNPYQPDDDPASVDRAITEENKGHKLMKKMGWTEGQSLGKSQEGFVEPIQVNMRAQAHAGLGSGGVERSMGAGGEPDKSQKWLKARERYERVEAAEAQAAGEQHGSPAASGGLSVFAAASLATGAPKSVFAAAALASGGSRTGRGAQARVPRTAAKTAGSQSNAAPPTSN